MNKHLPIPLLLLTLMFASLAPAQQPSSLDPAIVTLIQGVSVDRIAAIQKKLGSFGTRNISSRQDDPNFGIGAARAWIVDQLKSYSPRLQVRLVTYGLKKRARVPHDVQISDIVAVLPGTTYPDDEVMIGAHYDSIAIKRRPAGAGAEPGGSAKKEAKGAKEPPPPPPDPNVLAPGVTDDGSGSAAVMELARVMSQHQYKKTLVFMLFAGEEEGLLGSALYARDARKKGEQIEAVLSNDIIGTILAGDGQMDNTTVRVFSQNPQDSPSRELARYIRETGERYVPELAVDLIFRSDRFGRGGDHTSFNQEGYAAVRFTSAEENYSHQHSPTDNFENTSPPYVAEVAKVDGAVAASLALAPKAPLVIKTIKREGREIPWPMIGRGKSGYDATLEWKPNGTDPDLAGYVVRIRSTTAPFWERRIAVGDVTKYVMPDLSIDDYVFGVQAVDKNGDASLVSVYTLPARRKLKIETY
jgi:Peptidase family M28